MKTAPMARFLPYFAMRTVALPDATRSCMFLVDGTVVLGFSVTGTDVYAADNGRLNRIHQLIQQAMNALPGEGFAQWEWTTGGGFKDIIDDYAKRGGSSHPTIRELKTRRVAFLKGDTTLRRGELFLYVGIKKLLPELGLDGGASIVSSVLSMFSKQSNTPVLQREEVIARLMELSAVVTRVEQQLEQAKLKLRPLKDAAFFERIHTVLNPKTSRRVSAQVIEEAASQTRSAGQGSANAGGSAEVPLEMRAFTIREQMALSDLVWDAESFVLDGTHHSVLTLQRWPAHISPDFMFPIQFSSTAKIRVVSVLEATNRVQAEEKMVLERNITKAMSGGAARDHRAQLALSQREAALDEMASEDQRIFHTSLYAVVTADTKEALAAGVRDVVEATEKVGGVLTVEFARQHTAFLKTLPGYGTAPHRRSYQRTTKAASCIVPYFMPSTGDEARQVIYHTRQGGLRSIGYTTKTATKPNTNTLVLGGSGSGKSFNVSAIFEQACLAEDGPVLVVDVQGPAVSNYRTLCEFFDGTYTALSAGDDIAFNPFMPLSALCARDDNGDVMRDQRGAPLFDQEKLRYLSQLVCVMAVPNIATHPQEELCYQIARACILRAYVKAAPTNLPPLLQDVVEALSVYEPQEPEYKPLAREMYLQLDTWVKNPARAKLLNRHSKYASQSRLQVFDFFGLEKDEKLASVLLLSVAFNIWSTIYAYPRDVTKFILFDETWKLLTHPVAAKIVAELYRTGRKWGASTWAITQNLNDFLQSPIRSDLISNAATFILNQHATDHDRVIETLDLTPRHAGLFKSLAFRAGEYSELLYVEQASKDATVLRLSPSPFELWLNTSSADDVGFRSKVQRALGLSPLDTVRVCADHFPNGRPKSDPDAAIAALRQAGITAASPASPGGAGTPGQPPVSPRTSHAA